MIQEKVGCGSDVACGIVGVPERYRDDGGADERGYTATHPQEPLGTGLRGRSTYQRISATVLHTKERL